MLERRLPSSPASDELIRDLSRRAHLRKGPRLRRVPRWGLRLAIMHASRALGAATGRTFRVPGRLFWRDRMTLRLPELLSCHLFVYGYFEEGLTRILLSELRPSDVLYDIGAHYGYFTRLGARLVGPEGSVHSFEPTPSTFAMLRSNTEDLPTVSVNNAAVSDAAGEVRLHDFGPALSTFNTMFDDPLLPAGVEALPETERVVPAVSLDEYAEQAGAPDFVKIDAERAELQILQGMEGILRERRPKITVEVGRDSPGAPSSRSVLDHIVARGYRPLEHRGGEIRAHTLQETYEYANILLVPEQP